MNAPYILALDSASEKCSVAIAKGAQCLYEIVEHTPSMASERLVSMTQECLAKSGVSLNQMNYLVATKGPGSFTGLRINLSIAQGFLIALKNLTPIAFDSFAYYHYRAQKQVESFDYNIVLLDAYRAGAYVSVKNSTNSDMLPASILNEQELCVLLENIPANNIILISGNCVHKFYVHIKHLANLIILPRYNYTRAKILCQMALIAINNNSFDTSLAPYYIAPVNAKIPLK